MVDNGSSARDGLGRRTGWVPWLIAALIVMGGLTAIDLAFYRDDIHDESGDHGDEAEDHDDDSDLVEPGDDDAEGTDDDH